ncbi:site-specific DNA-methyltransferase [Candidatus Synechococcus spongiarum]|uniref:Type III restriction-modification system methylation subunit n=1 Tax=Candidatus Synechococcus spongiarum TaxID=431041 RepID=A0A165B1X2_9SYNE|nr:site-specific DNA-methyltransferase [Candidatus Synechococcus spongiarum]SAY39385.1 Type III restriction-modification system methylation subunit (EC 2.1.1.72) [Candidatus Synechococcus spongiarum]
MDKLKMHSSDLSQQNIAKIRELFPGCVTEARDEATGSLRLAVDFDQLRQELSGHIVEGPQERYRLDWPGKREALALTNAPITKSLRPCREQSVDFDTTQNLFIEGDNLEVLKLLQENYLGKVKMIYIDPPYNTGNDFVYDDDFVESSAAFLERSNQRDDERNRLVANTSANGRFHSNWLSMIYARLRLAKRFLTSDGAVFISIDDNEAGALIKIGREVFGDENFVAQLAVQLNPRGRHLDRFIANTHESVVIFVRDGLNSNCIGGLEKNGRMANEYNRSDSDGVFRLLGLRNRNQSFNPITRPNLYYPLYISPKDSTISLNKDEIFTDEVWPDTPDGTKTCWTWGKEKVAKEGNLLVAEEFRGEWRVFRKDYLNKDGNVAKTMAKSLWIDQDITNDYGRAAVKELFGKAVMDFPKSPALLGRLIEIGSNDGDVVLDFFAGSSSTAHALLTLNASKGFNRKFVMVQLPEATADGSIARNQGYETIADLSMERIRRAGKKVLEGYCHPNWNRDVGFRVLKVDTSNMKDVYYRPDEMNQSDLLDMVDNVKEGRTAEDLLFHVLVDRGVDLTLPIRRETVQGKVVFFVDDNALVACFDRGVTESLVKELAGHKPLHVVFRDSGFVSDAEKINVEQIFRQLSPTTEVKSI